MRRLTRQRGQRRMVALMSTAPSTTTPTPTSNECRSSRAGLERQCVHGALHQVSECAIDELVLLDAALARERRVRDHRTIMVLRTREIFELEHGRTRESL